MLWKFFHICAILPCAYSTGKPVTAFFHQVSKLQKLASIFRRLKKKSMNGDPEYGLTDNHVIQFLRELKERLHYNSMRKVIATLRLIFPLLRQTFDPSLNALIIEKTPRLLHLIFFNSCSGNQPEPNPTGFPQLDDVVGKLVEQDQATGKRMFRSEIDALRVVFIVLMSLEGLYNTAGIRLLHHNFVREIDNAVQEKEMII